MAKPFFFFLTSIIFTLVSIFHFLRLMFEWQIIIGGWLLPAWASGSIVLFGVFMVYWSIKLKLASVSKTSEKPEEKNHEQEIEGIE